MTAHETTDDDHDYIPPSIWMYVGIVIVSTAAFYITLLLTKLAY